MMTLLAKAYNDYQKGLISRCWYIMVLNDTIKPWLYFST